MKPLSDALIGWRIGWLPRRRKQFLIVVTDAAQKLALDSSTCVQILREAGHLRTTSLSCVVDLGNIPDGLNAADLERYLREHGAEPRAQQCPKKRLPICSLNAP